MDKKITNTHRLWLKNVENSIYYKMPLDNVGITSKRIDILFDMGLVDYGSNHKEQATYVLTEDGKQEVKKLDDFIARKKQRLLKSKTLNHG